MTPGRFRSDTLAAEVRDATYGGVRIGDDLARFDRVLGVDAPEAAVLYAGRVLELVTAEEVRATGGRASGNVFGNLIRLSELGVLAEQSARFSHSLRRLANEARHIQRPLVSDDAVLAEALLEQVLRWHFVRSLRGPRLASIHVDAVEPTPSDPLGQLIRVLDAEARPPVLRGVWSAHPGLTRSSFATALYAESLIAAGGADDLAEAEAAVAAAHQAAPDDLRLRQLAAWLVRLRGAPDTAATMLEALAAERDDVETLGLLAGTYKRLWADGGRPALLRRTAELYRRAWKLSDHRSTYAGVNAASMTLLDGQRDAAVTIARAVLALYEQRRGADAAIEFTGYWDLATYAEASLVVGAFDEAARAYRQAFAAHADRAGQLASTRAQLALLLGAVGAPTADPGQFLDGP